MEQCISLYIDLLQFFMISSALDFVVILFLAWMPLETSRFLLLFNHVTKVTAEDFCQLSGGQLAIVTTWREHNFLQRKMREHAQPGYVRTKVEKVIDPTEI